MVVSLRRETAGPPTRISIEPKKLMRGRLNWRFRAAKRPDASKNPKFASFAFFHSFVSSRMPLHGERESREK